jgi:superoxide reductase
MGIADKIQSADWKKEKHAPVIECPDTVQAGETFKVKVSIGKEIPHPNTIEHHISWIQIYFNPEGDKFAYDLGRLEFNAHGEAEAFTEPAAAVIVKISKPGTLHAVSHCNIHGLWESEKEVKVG